MPEDPNKTKQVVKTTSTTSSNQSQKSVQMDVNVPDNKKTLTIKSEPSKLRYQLSRTGYESVTTLDSNAEGKNSYHRSIVEFLDRNDDFSDYPGAERLEYDFVSERRNVFTTTIFESASQMIKAALGIGILHMHEAYMFAGIWTSLVLTVFIGLMCAYNTLLLVRVAQQAYRRIRVGKMSYPDLMEAAVIRGPQFLKRFRKIFRYTVDCFLIIELCSTCMVYQIMMARMIKKTLEATSDAVYKLKLDVRTYICIMMLPLLLLCLVKSLRFMSCLSVLADLFIALCIIVMLAYAIRDEPDLDKRYGWKDVHGMFRFTGILIYSIDSTIIALPIENHMKKPMYFPVVLWCAKPLIILSCTAVGFFGYWRWGERCTSPIILHLPLNVGAVILYSMFVVVLAVSYSVNFWVPFKLVWRYLKYKRIKHKLALWEKFFKLILILIITLTAVAFPHISHMISFFGNVLLGFITFIFPPLIEILFTYHDRFDLKDWAANVVSFIIGISVICGGIFCLVIPHHSQTQRAEVLQHMRN